MNIIFGKYADSIQVNELLAPHTYYKIGGPAEYFFVAHTADELEGVVRMAKKASIPVTVFGGGSNILVSSQGVKGLVVKTNGGRIESSSDGVFDICAGVLLGDCIAHTINNEYTGLEYLTGICGTIGGAVCTNAHAYNKEIKDFVEHIVCLDEEGNELTLSREMCKFGYRDSIFKHSKYTILKVRLKLEKGKKDEIKARMDQYKKGKNLIQPTDSPSCGFVFRHITFNELESAFDGKTIANMIQKSIDIEKLRIQGHVSAGFIIDYAGFKGKTIGGITVSEKNPNFFINNGSGKSDDVVMLISFVKQQIRDKYGIQLQEEVSYVGF